jgi:L-ascorbate metabolism protein UlaG (beta-lactamase superfamily)
MELIWYGHACFRLKDRNITLITDPYDKSVGFNLPRPKADIVTVSHESPHHSYLAGVKGDFKVIDGPGEYEIGGVFITGVNLSTSKKSANDDTLLRLNNVYVIYMDNVAVCHLGDLNQIPTQSQVEDMGSIDVLLVPVGGYNALNAAQAAEVISLIEPLIVVPMHYKLPGAEVKLDPVDKFLKEMGITKPDIQQTLKLTSSSLPEETQIVLMEAKL